MHEPGLCNISLIHKLISYLVIVYIQGDEYFNVLHFNLFLNPHFFMVNGCHLNWAGLVCTFGSSQHLEGEKNSISHCPRIYIVNVVKYSRQKAIIIRHQYGFCYS